jgi:hypothetical protein
MHPYIHPSRPTSVIAYGGFASGSIETGTTAGMSCRRRLIYGLQYIKGETMSKFEYKATALPQDDLTRLLRQMRVPNIEPGTVHYNALLTYAKFIRSKEINNDYGTERRLTPCLRWPD